MNLELQLTLAPGDEQKAACAVVRQLPRSLRLSLSAFCSEVLAELERELDQIVVVSSRPRDRGLR